MMKPFVVLGELNATLPVWLDRPYEIVSLSLDKDIEEIFIKKKHIAVFCGSYETIKKYVYFIRRTCHHRFVRILMIQDQKFQDEDLSFYQDYDIHGWCQGEFTEKHPTFLSAFSLYQKLVQMEVQKKGLNQILFFSVFSMQQKNVELYLQQAASEVEHMSLSTVDHKAYVLKAFFCRKKEDSGFDIIHHQKDNIFNTLTEMERESIEKSFQTGSFFTDGTINVFSYKNYALFCSCTPSLDGVRLELLSIYFTVMCRTIDTVEIEKEKSDLESIIEEKTRALNEVLQSKKNLLRVLYHDLNNTLSVMMPSIDFALNLPHEADEKKKKFLEKIKKSLKIQKDIIDQVRHIDALQSRKQLIDLQPVDLTEVLSTAYFVFKDKIREKNINFEFEIEERYSVLAEAISLSHSVLNNLISNAIKFSYPHGTIKISIKKIDQFWVVLSIKDSGIGIPKNMMDKIFREDCKTSRYGTSGEKGTGFGMPLVKNYIDGYGGKIEVESSTGLDDPEKKGTVFRIYLKNLSSG